MKTFLCFLLTIMVATGVPAPPASDEKKLDRHILKEIIDKVNTLEGTLKPAVMNMWVEAVTPKKCDADFLCKAEKVLHSLKAEELKLQEEHWLLPRMLVAYTRNIQCKAPNSDNTVGLRSVLNEIRRCAKNLYFQS